jgi:hypothetical protein
MLSHRRGMKMTRDDFYKWLISTGYTHNTAYSYSLAINRVSTHYSKKMGRNIDIYAIRDIGTLTDIKNKYGKHGIYSATGDYGNGTDRNAIRHYRDYAQQLYGRPQSRPDGETRDRHQNRDGSVAADLAGCHNIIKELRAQLAEVRDKGRRVVTDRDQWEAKAKGYEREVAALKKRFHRTKTAISKCLHPDGHPDEREKAVRGKYFKILWPQIQEIEKED